MNYKQPTFGYLRKLKIYYDLGDNKQFDEIIEFINSIFKGIKKYNIENGFYINSHLYKNNINQEIFLHNLKCEYFYIDYKLIFSVFQIKFIVDETEIKQIIKYILYKNYKLKIKEVLTLHNTFQLSIFDNCELSKINI